MLSSEKIDRNIEFKLFLLKKQKNKKQTEKQYKNHAYRPYSHVLDIPNALINITYCSIIINIIIIIISSPVVCLCHGFMSVVDRAPCSRWCLCRA